MLSRLHIFKAPGLTGLCGVLLSTFGLLVSSLQAQSLPPFKVAVHDHAGIILLVAATTSDSDLVNLVNALHAARATGSFKAFFPPTTPGGSKGPYAAADVFVMSDPVWATPAHFEAFMDPPASSTPAQEKEFARRVRAYYLASVNAPDTGSIGYEDQDLGYKTPNYRKLF